MLPPNPLARLFPQNSSEVSVRGHMPAVDGVRGLAILLVLLCHFSAPLSGLLPGSIQAGLQLGRHGVDLFFVLSGFLITGILIDAKDRPRFFLNFYGRRAVRIFPLYYLVLLAIFVGMPLFGVGQDESFQRLAAGQGAMWGYYSNFVMASNASWCYVASSVDLNHFWSLAVEEQFYIVWPLVIYLLPRRALFAGALALVVIAVASRAGFLWMGASPTSVFLLTPCRLDALGAGALVAIAARDPRWAPRLIRAARHVGAGVALLFAALAWLKGSDVLFHTFKYIALAGLFGGMLVLTISVEATPAKNFFSSRFLRFFGKYSYGIYVFHIVLVPAFMHLFSPEILARTLHLSPLAAGVLFMVLATAASVGVAMVSWIVIEKPCLSLKRFFDAPADPAAPVTLPAIRAAA